MTKGLWTWLISLAGISKGSVRREETFSDIRSVLAVNLEGMINTIEPILPLFRERRRGHIAFTSSYAGFRGFPVAPSYCAAKAATRVYGEGLRARLSREGVGISVIIPGFVKTPMTDANPYFMPFRVTAERAAALIKRGLAQNNQGFASRVPYQRWCTFYPSCRLPGLTDSSPSNKIPITGA